MNLAQLRTYRTYSFPTVYTCGHSAACRATRGCCAGCWSGGASFCARTTRRFTETRETRATRTTTDQKKQRTLRRQTLNRSAHEGAEERERRAARAPQGDPEGRRRADRRRGVGRNGAAAARGGAGAGLRAHHDDEAGALLGAARELAGGGAGADPGRGGAGDREQAREARAGLERDEQRKQREKARVVEPHDVRGVQRGHGEAQQRVEQHAHREDVPAEHDAVRQAHREDRVERGERAKQAAGDLRAVVRVREEHDARVQRDGRPHRGLLRAAREARVHVHRQVRRQEEVHVPRERVPIRGRALHAVRERHRGGAQHGVRGRARPRDGRAIRRVRAGAVTRLDLAREVAQADVLAVQRDVEDVHAHARFARR